MRYGSAAPSVRSLCTLLLLSLCIGTPAKAQQWKAVTTWPMSGSTDPDRITSLFGIRNKPGYDCHRGLDVRANYNRVQASYNGIVTKAEFTWSGGKTLKVAYVRVAEPGYLNFRYLHLDSFIDSVPNTGISQWDDIAISGNTGQSYAPHLHFETAFSRLPYFIDSVTFARFHPGLYLPGIADSAPIIAQVDTVLYGDGSLNWVELVIEEPQQRFNMNDFIVRIWEPFGQGTLTLWWDFAHFTLWETYSNQVPKKYDIDHDSIINAGDYYPYTLGTDVKVTAEEYSSSGSDPFRLHIRIRPGSIFLGIQNYGVRVNSYSGLASEWGQVNNGPESLIEEFTASCDGSAIMLDGSMVNCAQLSHMKVARSVGTATSESIVFEADLSNPESICGFRITDSTADPTSDYTYRVIVLDRTGREHVAGSCVYKGLPSTMELAQNYPNPFNPSTSIEFSIPPGPSIQADLRVINVVGQVVATLHSGLTAPGTYLKQWNGNSDGGGPVASGVYFYQLNAGNVSETKKMVLLK